MDHLVDNLNFLGMDEEGKCINRGGRFMHLGRSEISEGDMSYPVNYSFSDLYK